MQKAEKILIEKIMYYAFCLINKISLNMFDD